MSLNVLRPQPPPPCCKNFSTVSIGHGGTRTFSIFWFCVYTASHAYLCYFQALWLQFWILMIFGGQISYAYSHYKIVEQHTSHSRRLWQPACLPAYVSLWFRFISLWLRFVSQSTVSPRESAATPFFKLLTILKLDNIYTVFTNGGHAGKNWCLVMKARRWRINKNCKWRLSVNLQSV